MNRGRQTVPLPRRAPAEHESRLWVTLDFKFLISVTVGQIEKALSGTMQTVGQISALEDGMAHDLVQIRELAQRKEDENYGFRQFLKTQCNLQPDEIDRRVFETTRRVWAGVDCTTCANCCREMKPTLSEQEVDRVARRLGMERQQFIETYLERSETNSENPWQTRAAPCPFLKDNLCSVYEDRPAECSGYPYLYKPDFVSRTLGMIARTFTCPIVYEVMEELKKSLGFLPTVSQPPGKGGNRKSGLKRRI